MATKIFANGDDPWIECFCPTVADGIRGFKAARRIITRGLQPRSVSAVLIDRFASIKKRWEETRNSAPTRDNWALKLRTGYAGDHCERKFEAEIAKQIFQNGRIRNRWGSQIPVLDGVCGRAATGIRIDMIHRSATRFTIIDLKIGHHWRDTPLTTAIQLAEYAVMYAFSRYHAQTLGYDRQEHPVLFADHVNFDVAAQWLFWRRFAGRDPKLLDSYLEEILRPSFEDGINDLFKHLGLPVRSRFEFSIFGTPPQQSPSLNDFMRRRAYNSSALRKLGR